MGARLREVVLWIGAVLGLLAVATWMATAFLGFSLLVFRSGSMGPTIPTGGLALARSVSADELRTGDVVSVTSSSGDRITHRVVTSTPRGDETSLVLKGDANSTPDPEVYRVGGADRVVVSVPWAGYVLAYLMSPAGLILAGALASMLVVVTFAPASASGETAARPRRRPTSARRARHRRPRARRGGVVAVSVLMVGCAVVGAGSRVSGTWATFSDRATLTSGSFDSARYFTCNAAVRGVAAPYLYWKLDETSAVGATAADSSGTGHPGTYRNPALATYGQPKACKRDTGTAVTFNGATGIAAGISTYATSAYATTTSAIAGPNTFTVSIWFKTTTTTGGKLIGFGDSNNGSSGTYDRHLYLTDNGRVVFGVYPNTVKTILSGPGFNDNAWHNASGTLSAAGMSLYVDGVLIGTDPTTTSGQTASGVLNTAGFSGYWRVGYDNLGSWTSSPTSFAFAGTLDEAAVWTTALSASDIAALATAGR